MTNFLHQKAAVDEVPDTSSREAAGAGELVGPEATALAAGSTLGSTGITGCRTILTAGNWVADTLIVN